MHGVQIDNVWGESGIDLTQRYTARTATLSPDHRLDVMWYGRAVRPPATVFVQPFPHHHSRGQQHLSRSPTQSHTWKTTSTTLFVPSRSARTLKTLIYKSSVRHGSKAHLHSFLIPIWSFCACSIWTEKCFRRLLQAWQPFNDQAFTQAFCKYINNPKSTDDLMIVHLLNDQNDTRATINVTCFMQMFNACIFIFAVFEDLYP